MDHVSLLFSLNINKTNFMLFKNKHDNRHIPAFNITIDNTDIVRVSHTKFLDTKITFNLMVIALY